eukprot:12649447-Alexandrium_andersonii.AAC.1
MRRLRLAKTPEHAMIGELLFSPWPESPTVWPASIVPPAATGPNPPNQQWACVLERLWRSHTATRGALHGRREPPSEHDWPVEEPFECSARPQVELARPSSLGVASEAPCLEQPRPRTNR